MTMDTRAESDDTETTDAAPDDTAVTDRPATGRGRGRWVPWVVAGLALAAAVAFAVLWWQTNDRASQLEAAESDRAAVRLAARQVILDLTTWDATDGLDEEIAALRDQGTGPFLDEIESQFDAQMGAELESLEVGSPGEIEEVFVQEVSGESAEAFVMVTHTYVLPQGRGVPLLRPATVQLRRVDGRWLVQSVDLPAPDDELTGMLNQLEVGE